MSEQVITTAQKWREAARERRAAGEEVNPLRWLSQVRPEALINFGREIEEAHKGIARIAALAFGVPHAPPVFEQVAAIARAMAGERNYAAEAVAALIQSLGVTRETYEAAVRGFVASIAVAQVSAPNLARICGLDVPSLAGRAIAGESQETEIIIEVEGNM